MSGTKQDKRKVSKRKLSKDTPDEVKSVEAPKAKKARSNHSMVNNSATHPGPEAMSPQVVASKRRVKNVEEKDLAVRKASRRGRGNRGLLQAVKDMPADVLCVIFSSLEPIDLLRLSRTSKDLRAFLLSRLHSEHAWRAAREAMIGLPPLPRDESEPAYASFVFDTHCQECGAHRADCYIDWVSRIRLCSKCLQRRELYQKQSSLDSMPSTPFLHGSMPEMTGPTGGDSRFLFNAKFQDSLKQAASKMRHRFDYSVFAEQWKKDYEAAQAEASKIKEYIVHRAQVQSEIRKSELKSLRKQRSKAIFARLEASGWSKELTPDVRDALANHTLVNRSQALTDRIWMTIEPTLLELMENVKISIPASVGARLTYLAEYYETFLRTQPLNPSFPPLVTVADSSPIRELIHDTPSFGGITKRAFLDIFHANILTIANDWRKLHDEQLKELLVCGGLKPILESPLSAFLCRTCGLTRADRHRHNIVLYSDALRHLCCTRRRPPGVYYSYEALTYSTAHLCPAPASHIDHIRFVIGTCGMDPETATVEEMDKLDVFLTCKLCQTRGWDHFENCEAPPSPGTWAMRWRTAIAHSHVGSEPVFSLITNPRHHEKVRELEQKSHRSFPIMCKHCGRTCGEPTDENKAKHTAECHISSNGPGEGTDRDRWAPIIDDRIWFSLLFYFGDADGP
ncbi:hypothetical protein CYLTODRAFT_490458 [Cylindrobasidium torrendii FP15055 ss-10]|uniref:F-box domain-containing protein n=1 Tax=Cylindrobasidium torrendii FP15055 ss-10 TaxID=1314674 RepID=A0A0D7BAR7_9AGAR|nr:hypothetical protein CYLTODRAFT_490458 [Cylindrobasidium torrendii FP15055 ss-10]